MTELATIELDTPTNDRGHIRLENGKLICKNAASGAEWMLADGREFSMDEAIEYIEASYADYRTWKMEWVER